MRLNTICLLIGMACSLPISAASAADWNYGAGGIKDYGLAGVPVPAPVPVMETYGWYVRGDLGAGVSVSGNSSTRLHNGSVFNGSSDHSDGPFHGSIGFGRYLSGGFRWDLLFDYRGKSKDDQPVINYIDTVITGTGANQRIDTYNVQRNQEVRVANHTLMANLYYDFNRGGRFVPYIGAGFGLLAREGRADVNENGTCLSTTIGGVLQPADSCTPLNLARASTASGQTFNIAASAMAGFTVAIGPQTFLDSGYRLLWQGGNNEMVDKNLLDRITVGSRIDHEIRMGLRWNIW